ncbi:MAG: HD domain-containing protein [Sinobacteraceae bacterium]|nr:HD domain-containing protein [Nevskiaceae bacterium]
MRVEFSSIIVFTGLISIAVGVILATTLSTVDRSARYWIAGALLSGLAALMRTVTPQGDHLIGVSIPNAVNFLINLMFALSLRALTQNSESHRRLLTGGIIFAVLYAALHEVFAELDLALIEVIVNPIVQIAMASLIGYFAVKLYQEKGFRFAAVLAVLQGMLALLWVARGVTGVSQGRIDFAALSVVNAFIFTPLMLVGTVRLLCYLGLRLEEYVAKTERSGADGLLNTLNTLALSRDNETGNHVLRTQKFVRLLAEHLQARGKLDTQGIRDYPRLLHDVAPLHDIGKVGIPDRILKKPGSLDPAEWEVMRTHTTLGAEVIDAARTPQTAADSYVNDVLHIARQVALSHHENWDGSGYPHGLAGKRIPQAAQLMAIADAYDALRSERVYKKAWSHDEAVADIVSLSGKRFDPELVGAFIGEAQRFRAIAETYHD